MNASNDPIIELRGCSMQDISHRYLQRSPSQQIPGTIGFSSVIFVRIISFLYKYYAAMRPLFGIKYDATLRFYKDRVEFFIDTTLFWFVVRGRQHHNIPWSRIAAIHGQRTSLLFFFKRCFLFVPHSSSADGIIDLGYVPEATFLQLLEQLNVLSRSQGIRQQLNIAPNRLSAKGLLLPALVIAGMVLLVGCLFWAFVYEPQLQLYTRLEAQQYATEMAQQAEADSERRSEWQRELKEESAYLAKLEVKYRQVLAVDPGNLKAQQGLTQLAEHYVGLARRAVGYKLFGFAEEFFVKAKQLDSNLRSVDALRRKMEHVFVVSENTKIDTPTAGEVTGEAEQLWQGPKAVKNSAPEALTLDSGFAEEVARLQLRSEANKNSVQAQKKYAWLVDNGDGTISDSRTGLVGLKKPCFGKKPWKQAMSAATRLANGICDLTDGSSVGDWRLLTKAELPMLVEWEKSAAFVVEQGRSYWSSTSYADDTSFAWLMYPRDGYISYRDKTSSSYDVWPVRGR